MNEKRIRKLRQRFQGKSSEELTAIWVENDRTQWADETFAAIKRILTERNEPIPEQRAAPKPPEEPAWRRKRSSLRQGAGLLFCLGLLVSILVNGFLRRQIPAADTFVAGCVLGGVGLLIASFAVRKRKD